MKQTPGHSFTRFLCIFMMAWTFWHYAYEMATYVAKSDFRDFGLNYYYARELSKIPFGGLTEREKARELLTRTYATPWEEQEGPEPVPYIREIIFYPLAYLLLLRPLTWLSYPFAAFLWFCLNQLLLVLSALLCLRFFEERLSFERLALFIFAIGNFIPLWMTLNAGQNNLLALFLIVVALDRFRKGQDFLCGALLSLATLVKVYPAILLFYFLLKREWKVLLSSCTCLLAFFAISIFRFGWLLNEVQMTEIILGYGPERLGSLWNFSIGSFWFALLTQGGGTYAPAQYYIKGLVHQEGIATLCYWVSVAALLLITARLVKGRTERHASRQVYEFCLFLVLLVIVVPWSSVIHQIFILFPLLLILLKEELDLRSRSLAILAYLLTGTAYWPDGWEPLRQAPWALFLFGRLYGAMILFYLLGKVMVRKQIDLMSKELLS